MAAWVPHPKQRAFLELDGVDEALYGGAAAGGKTDTLVSLPLRWIHMPQLRVLLLRRTMPQLRHIIGKTYERFKEADPTATYQKQEHVWKFSSGAEVWCAYLESPADQWRYHGQEFQIVLWDELTEHATDESYLWMWSRMRSVVGPDGKEIIPCFMRASTNPGGPGHAWVRERFVEPYPAGNKFIRSRVQIDDGTVVDQRRIYIPATVYDNPSIDPVAYAARLAHLPHWRREALLRGNWDVYEGAAFKLAPDMVLSDMDWWPSNALFKWRSMDWGTTHPGCCLWHAMDADGVVYTYRELYFKEEDPATIAGRIREIEELAGERDIQGVLDPQCWANGVSGPIVELFAREGVRWRQANRHREQGFSEVNTRCSRRRTIRIAGKEESAPYWYIHKRCKYLLRTLQAIPADPHKEDVDRAFTDDHAYDAARYGFMYRPLGRTGYKPRGTGPNEYYERSWRSRDPITGM